ncbi:hypothetical protein [Bowmanella denitrificans]|uniref:hypothetical protein n=1 Tax=Bowmanella denitrificans TaxID=366582 RepID=UPI000C9BE450|nr:hypothetical protein [Bowmanella denitrificans]
MSWLTALAAPVTGVINGVVDIFRSKQERKKLAETAKAKLAAQKEKGAQEVTLTDAEWESLNVGQQDNTWKDEYITILITSPLLLIVVGTVWTAFTGDLRLVQAGIESIKAMTAAGVDMEFMMEAVVLAAIGLKLWRKS